MGVVTRFRRKTARPDPPLLAFWRVLAVFRGGVSAFGKKSGPDPPSKP